MSFPRPPVPGEDHCIISYMSGYSARQRHEAGAALLRLVMRFMEFATARQPGAGYSIHEPSRFTTLDRSTPTEFILTGGSVPQDLSLSFGSLTTLLENCRDLVWADPAEARASSGPNIMFSPDMMVYLAHLKVSKTVSFPMILEGYLMKKVDSRTTYAYPFKVYVLRMSVNEDHYLKAYELAFGGKLKEFNEKIFEYHKLKLTLGMNPGDSRLEYLHRNGPVYLTRGGRLTGNSSIFVKTHAFSGG